MQYRDYGEKGFRVSALSFGAMRLPTKDDKVDFDKAVDVLTYAISKGVNLIDTAHGYHGGDSEKAVGMAVKNADKKIYVSTKNPYYKDNRDEWLKTFDLSQERLQLDCVDILFFHFLSYENFQNKVIGGPRFIEGARKLQKEGRIRFLGFSSHDSPENIIKMIDSGEFDAILVQYNLLDRANEPAIAHAHEKGLGVQIMGPVGGGRLASPSEVLQKVAGARSTPEIALRFVLANPGVSTAMSGMNTRQMVDENVEACSREEPLTAEEKQQIEETLARVKKLSELYCTGCKYCMPCPNDVNIPENFTAMNYYRVWGLKDLALQIYGRLGTEEHPNDRGLRASACKQCGKCEPKCPQKIPIMKQLEEVAATLEPELAKKS